MKAVAGPAAGLGQQRGGSGRVLGLSCSMSGEVGGLLELARLFAGVGKQGWVAGWRLGKCKDEGVSRTGWQDERSVCSC